MAVFDEESVFGARPVKPAAHVVGENVDALSVHELDERIARLGAEIERLQKARGEREATRLAAEQAFRR
jgi:uncharacterized small protein (DUF1192 family)